MEASVVVQDLLVREGGTHGPLSDLERYNARELVAFLLANDGKIATIASPSSTSPPGTQSGVACSLCIPEERNPRGLHFIAPPQSSSTTPQSGCSASQHLTMPSGGRTPRVRFADSPDSTSHSPVSSPSGSYVGPTQASEGLERAYTEDADSSPSGSYVGPTQASEGLGRAYAEDAASPWDESESPAFPPMPFAAHDDEVWTGGMRTGGMKTPGRVPSQLFTSLADTMDEGLDGGTSRPASPEEQPLPSGETVLDTRASRRSMAFPSSGRQVRRPRTSATPASSCKPPPPLKGSEPMGTLSPDDSTLPPDSPGSPAVPLTAGERFTCEDVRGGGDDGDDRDQESPLIPLTAAERFTCAPVDGAASIGDLSPKATLPRSQSIRAAPARFRPWV